MNESGVFQIRRMLKFIVSLAVSLYTIFSVPVFVLAGLLLAHGETLQGRLFAIAVITGLPVPVVLWVGSHLKRKRGTMTAAGVLAVVALLLLGIDYGLTPDGLPLRGSSVRSCFTGPTAYRRASMANIVPEMDQLILATYVVPEMDPLMDGANTTELRGQVRDIYGEMRRSREFECLGSVLRQTYSDLFLDQRPVGHFYEYIPGAATNARLPVVLFLHGSLGNFRAYLWVWKRMADEYGFAIVAPTFGAGEWDKPGGEEAIEQARQYCASHPALDSSRIYLAGLSNGGRGVCLGARRSPDAYRGLIFISPVLDPDVLLTEPFVAAWKDKPILILHGAADNRIPISYIKEAADSLVRRGMRLDCQFYDEQTHFLFFTIRDKVRDKIGSWLKNNGPYENQKDGSRHEL